MKKSLLAHYNSIKEDLYQDLPSSENLQVCGYKFHYKDTYSRVVVLKKQQYRMIPFSARTLQATVARCGLEGKTRFMPDIVTTWYNSYDLHPLNPSLCWGGPGVEYWDLDWSIEGCRVDE